MTSVFDRDAFNAALFFPRDDASPPPPGAVDRFCERDGARVHVRSYAADGAKCTLLLFHGNGEVVADYDDAAAQFAQIGAALAVADYRGYGQSTGVPSLRALIADAAPTLALTPGQPLIAMGRSLGGAAAHELFARPPARLAGVVLESAFSDLRALVRRRGLTPPAAFTDDELATFEPARKLAHGRLPLLVLHGARDELVVPAEARAAHDAAAGAAHRELVYVPERGHNDVSHSPVYWDALRAFVDRVAG